MLLMGILNVTPDSFSDGGRYTGLDAAVAHAEALVEGGADWIDVGGESTRPGAEPVDPTEERQRTEPVVRALVARGFSVSIDTRRPWVARAALDAGATWINDVSGFRDPEMVALAQEARCRVCIMHMQGEPQTMQANPVYRDVVEEVAHALGEKARELPDNEVWLDPGIGFGKTLDHNLALLRSIPVIGGAYPVLIGVSRKSFLAKLLGPLELGERGPATLGAELAAIQNGARAIRTHDVRALSQALRVFRSIAQD